jgi:hypothetical protein
MESSADYVPPNLPRQQVIVIEKGLGECDDVEEWWF